MHKEDAKLSRENRKYNRHCYVNDGRGSAKHIVNKGEDSQRRPRKLFRDCGEILFFCGLEKEGHFNGENAKKASLPAHHGKTASFG